MERNELAEKLEIIGSVFEIDGMAELLEKFKTGMNPVQFNAVVIQVSGLLIKNDQGTADRIIMMNTGKDEKELEKMDDAAYANALKNAIITDVMGFFASSPPSDGKK